MEIKIKLKDVLILNDTLKQIIDDNKVSDVSLKFKILTILKSLETHVQNFNIIREQKIIEFGSEDENGNIRIDKNNSVAMEQFKCSMDSLIQTEMVIVLSKLKQDEIFNKGIKSEYLMGMYPIIEE